MRYFPRNIDRRLDEWFSRPHRTPLLITGVRQCGKTRTLLEFAHRHYKNVIYLNFWESEDAKKAFEGSLLVDDILFRLSSVQPSSKFVPGKTIIILDEIQDCPRARLALKSFKTDGRFDVGATGSYIGINVVSGGGGTPMPNGSEEVFQMGTMGFDEFLLARGYDQSFIDRLLDYLDKRMPIDPLVHERMLALYQVYMAIGGYPEVVSSFLEDNSLSACHQKLRSLSFSIKGDPAKRLDERGRPYYSPSDIARIGESYDLIASFNQSAENGRYVVSRIKTGSSNEKKDAIAYLLNAEVAIKVENLTGLSLPLELSAVPSSFRLYYSDIGLLTSRFPLDTFGQIALNGELGMNKGFLYEAAVASSLRQCGIKPYFFRKPSGLEIDFVIDWKGCPTMVEVKARDGRAKAAKTVLSHPEHYGKTRLLKLGSMNVGEEGGILSMPYYLTFALGRTSF